ncbi:hypothetical protein N7490_005433 [Penicillium lividum]|nr:hypothetical protein N7490_005433 [Penicillium lividum]
MTMSSTISFGGFNSGYQTGINNGTINNHTHTSCPLPMVPNLTLMQTNMNMNVFQAQEMSSLKV